MAQVFVSYSRRSEEVTFTVVADLKALGHDAWFDADLVGGQAWWDRILERIRTCDVFVFVLDEKSLGSSACRSELQYALDLGRPILPVLVGEGVSSSLLPAALSQTQFVDYRQPDRTAALRLARALVAMPPPCALPATLPRPPELPVSYLARLGHQIDDATPLNYEAQSALVLDLRRGMRDTDTAADALQLLERLRKRRDLLATIADEIDTMLPGRQAPSDAGADAIRQAQATAARTLKRVAGAAASPVARVQEEPVEPEWVEGDDADAGAPATPDPPAYGWRSVLLLAGAGGVAEFLTIQVLARGNGWQACFATAVVLGAALWIVREVPGALPVVAAGAVAGWVLVAIVAGASGEATGAMPLGGLFGAPVGAMLGAMAAAAVYRRRRRRARQDTKRAAA